VVIEARPGVKGDAGSVFILAWRPRRSSSAEAAVDSRPAT
jgi:hypothetical protein